MNEPTDYKRAYQKQKLNAKTLQKKLAVLQQEIQTRCRNYLAEIARLKSSNNNNVLTPTSSSRLTTKPRHKGSTSSDITDSNQKITTLPCTSFDRSTGLGFSQRTVDVKVGDPYAPVLPAPSLSFQDTPIKMTVSCVSTVLKDQLEDQNNCNLTTPFKKKSEECNAESRMLSGTKTNGNDEANSSLQDDNRSDSNLQSAQKQEIQKLKQEVIRLRQIRLETEKVRKSYRDSVNNRDSCSEDESAISDLTNERINHLETELRMSEQKVYVYQGIFVKIYNLLIQDKKESMSAISQIRSVKYNDLETKLRTLFSLIKINMDNVMLIGREKQELLKQVDMLSKRVRGLSAQTPITHEAQVQTSLPYEGKEKNGTKCSTYMLDVPIKHSAGTSKQQYLSQIKTLYNEQIQAKYAEIRCLKENLKSLITEIERYPGLIDPNKSQILSYSREYTETDYALNEEQEGGDFVKRLYSSTRLIKRKLLECNKVQESSSDPSSPDSSELIVKVLQVKAPVSDSPS